ncbi:MAG: efflux RND transporter periplasmic adaptor subunit [Gammaproteobacteria bacterium]|nr:MAG: efflux RND transporter periplasmic adaptor subunit [Gammaproteobacteria bacterium]
MKPNILKTLFIFLFITMASPVIAEMNSAHFQEAGPFKVWVELNPEVPRVGKNKVTIWVQDKTGQPLGGAALKVVAVMPSMGSMPAMYAPAEMNETEVGQYEGTFQPSMGGEWPLTIEIEADAGKGSITFDLATGRKGLRCATCASTGFGGSADVPGTVRVDPARRQLIGITTGRVRQKELRITTRAVGSVTYNETRLRDVALKFSGWIGELTANAVGKPVKKGEPLFTVYSPELLSAQEEYQEVLRRTSAKEGKHRLAAARRRLRLWDISDAQIEALEKRGRAQEYVAILSPASGVVIDKKIVEGSAFKAGQRLLRIADLSRVWVEAQVYDYELPLIKVGMMAKVVLPELQDREYPARVDFIYPFMEGDTHTARVRVVLDNSDGFLRPAMYAHVHLKAKLGKRLVVPESAVLYSGQSRVVFLDLGDGRLAPRKIKTGLRNRKWIEVLEGLEAGDTVVTSGNFLIAAESKLKAGVESW